MTTLTRRYRTYRLPPTAQQVQDGWAKVRDEGHCRMCERPWSVRRPTRHHLVPMRHGGMVPSMAWHPDNIVGLCRPCHDLIDHPSPHRAQARREFARLLTVAESYHATRWMGRGWLRRAYGAGGGNATRKRYALSDT